MRDISKDPSAGQASLYQQNVRKSTDLRRDRCGRGGMPWSHQEIEKGGRNESCPVCPRTRSGLPRNLCPTRASLKNAYLPYEHLGELERARPAPQIPAHCWSAFNACDHVCGHADGRVPYESLPFGVWRRWQAFLSGWRPPSACNRHSRGTRSSHRRRPSREAP